MCEIVPSMNTSGGSCVLSQPHKKSISSYGLQNPKIKSNRITVFCLSVCCKLKTNIYFKIKQMR